VLYMETNLVVSFKMPGRCGIRGSYRNERWAQTRHNRSGIVVKFRRSYIAKDAVCKVHHEAEFSLLLVSVLFFWSLCSTRVRESHVPVFWAYQVCSVHTSCSATPRDSRTEIILIAFCFEHDAVRCRL
jgi:hypothetical protein